MKCASVFKVLKQTLFIPILLIYLITGYTVKNIDKILNTVNKKLEIIDFKGFFFRSSTYRGKFRLAFFD